MQLCKKYKHHKPNIRSLKDKQQLSKKKYIVGPKGGSFLEKHLTHDCCISFDISSPVSQVSWLPKYSPQHTMAQTNWSLVSPYVWLITMKPVLSFNEQRKNKKVN